MSWDEFLDDMTDLAEVLGTHEETEATADSLRRIAAFIEHSWHTNLSAKSGPGGVEVPIPRNKAMHPRLSRPEKAFIQFNFVLGDDFRARAMPIQADFQVCVMGYLEAGNSIVELEDHWRVDSHLFPKPENANEPHPYFHFQRGGHAQESFSEHHRFLPSERLPDNEDASWRGLMQSPGPRIPMLPYCPILAIDFVIGQHDGHVWRRLRNTTEYLTLVRRAQSRLWEPFFEAIVRPEFRTLWMGPVFA
jgi:hypothetical protein